MKSLTIYIYEHFDKQNIKPFELKKANKKSAICSFGRCALHSTNVRSVDLQYTYDILKNVYGRDVNFVSRPVKDESELDYYKNIEDIDLNDYDEVWVYMSPENCFGGKFNRESPELFEKIGKFNGDLYGILVDPKIPPTNYGDFMMSRKKNGCIQIDGDQTYRGVTDKALSEFTKRWNKMKIAFGGLDYNKYYNDFEEKRDKEDEEHEFSLPMNNGKYEWCHFPLFSYYAKQEKYDDKIKEYPFKRKYDLVYFGNNRGGQRNKFIEQYYDVKGLNNYLIGLNLEFQNCKHEAHEEYVNHDELFKLICENAYATVVVGDPLHNNNYMTPRFFEAMLLDIVAFISNEYDEEHKLIKNKELSNFIYVNSGEDVKEKIVKLKSDEKFFRHIINLQRNEVDRIYKEYIK